MKCPGCFSQMLYSGGKDTKDFSCSTPKICPCRSECHYDPHVSVMPGWWFAERYNLPFKMFNEWYCVVGPENTYKWGYCIVGPENLYKWDESILYKLYQESTLYKLDIGDGFGIVASNVYGSIKESIQKKLFSIPYMALPVNEDFDQEFSKLVKKFEMAILLADGELKL